MNKLKTLVYMQLKEKLNLKGKKVSKKTILFSSIFSLLKFILVIGLCYILLYIYILLSDNSISSPSYGENIFLSSYV